VTSVNAVGYVNKQIHLNWNLIGAPFQTQNNDPSYYQLQNLLPADQMKNNLVAYILIPPQVAFFSPSDGFWDGGDVLTIDSGNGVIIFNDPQGQTPQAFTFTTVGQVAQSVNNAPIPRPQIPIGYSIQSSQVPQEGAIGSVLGFVPQADCNVVVYQGPSYQSLGAPYFYSLADGFWDPEEPVLGYADACFLFSTAPQSWNRTFTVN
jgi:hypothetical protein